MRGAERAARIAERAQNKVESVDVANASHDLRRKREAIRAALERARARRTEKA